MKYQADFSYEGTLTYYIEAESEEQAGVEAVRLWESGEPDHDPGINEERRIKGTVRRVERLELLRSECKLRHDRGQWMLMWPEALRRLQAVLDDDDEMTNDAEHDLLVEIAEACGLELPEYCGGCGSTHTGERCDDEDTEAEEAEQE